MNAAGRTTLAICVGLLVLGCNKDQPAARGARPSPAATRPAPAATPTTRPAAAPTTRPTTAAAAASAPAPTQPATPTTSSAAPDAKLAEIVALEKQGEFTQAWRGALEARSTFAASGHMDDLNQLMGRLRDEKTQAAQLAGAVKLLGSPTAEGSQVAAAELTAAGEVGILLLRRAVRTEPPAAAVRAVAALLKLNDADSGAAFAERLKAGAEGPLRIALLEALAAHGDRIPPGALRGLYQSVKDGEFAANRQAVAVLAAAFQKAADSDPARFAQLLGEADALARLKAVVAKALDSKDPAVAEAAAAAVADLGMMLRGLRGSYYDGTEFGKLLFEKLDAQVDIADGKLPYPDGGQVNRSIRWTGLIRIPVEGEYTFVVTCDDGARLWIDDKQIIDQWRSGAAADYSAKCTLTKGLHPIKLEYFQGQGPNRALLAFSGPGIDKQTLGDKYLFTAPWSTTAPVGGGSEKSK